MIGREKLSPSMRLPLGEPAPAGVLKPNSK